MAVNMTEEQERQRADLLQLRLDEANLLLDDLLRRVQRLKAENEALWEERGGPR